MCWYRVLQKNGGDPVDEQKKTSGSLALNSAPQVITIHQRPSPGPKAAGGGLCPGELQLRGPAQLFAAQNARYTELITANPEWELVDVYADKGITGTSAEKREDFSAPAGGLPGAGGQDPGEVLLPVRPERQGVPGDRPGAEGSGRGGCVSRSRALTPLSWPVSS